MSHYSNGKAREYKVRDDMIAHGWHLVSQSGGSKGAVDIVLIHPEYGHAYVQVGSQSKTLGPDARERLCHLADLGGALALLAVVVPRQPIAYWQVNRNTPRGWDRWDLASNSHPACARRVSSGFVHYACGISVEQGDYEGGVYAEHVRQATAAKETRP